MHQVVTAQLARRRAGTQSTKTRSEVRGGGAKPYRQKGTGNARQGSTNAPHYTGGGVALGPKPARTRQRTPKKMIKLALRSALSDRAADGKVLVVDSWGFDAPGPRTPRLPSARSASTAARSWSSTATTSAAALSFRNLPEVQLIQVGELNAYDVLANDWIVFTKAGSQTAGPWSPDHGSRGEGRASDTARRSRGDRNGRHPPPVRRGRGRASTRRSRQPPPPPPPPPPQA